MKKLALPILFALLQLAASAQSWVTLGQAGFSAGGVNSISLAIDNRNGTPYVGYMDFAYGNKASVKMFNGEEWTYVGRPGFTTDAAYNTSVATDGNGNLYIAFRDWANDSRLTVMKFADTGWVFVGPPGFTSSGVDAPVITIDQTGTLLVAFSAPGANVMKYTDTGWAYVGSPNFSVAGSLFISLALNPAGQPYVAFKDESQNGKASVMGFNGSDWQYIGAPGFAGAVSESTSIAIASDNTVYMSMSGQSVDSSSGEIPAFPAYVMKFQNGAWQSTGNIKTINGLLGWMTLAISGQTPYLAYVSSVDSEKVTVDEYNNGQWQTLGSACFSPATQAGLPITIWNGAPYVAFSDANSNEAVVMTTGDWLSVPATPATYPENITISPNPSGGSFAVRVSTSYIENVPVVIINSIGEAVFQQIIKSNLDQQINLDASPGLYFLSAQTASGVSTQKIILK